MDARLFLRAGLLFLAGSGCGGDPPTGTLTGKVFHNNQLLRSGSLTFVDAHGQEMHTAIGPEGTYRISKLPLGKVRVRVVSHARTPFGAVPPTPGKTDGTELEVEVRRGEQEFNIEMKP